MKKLLVILCFLSILPTAWGKAKERKPSSWGAQCGLTDTWGETADYDSASVTFDVGGTRRIVKSLPPIVKEQIVACAARVENPGKTYEDAVKALRESSEGSEVYVMSVTVKGKKYSVISYYGGGNHTGCIFKWGKSKMHASIGDDDLACE